MYGLDEHSGDISCRKCNITIFPHYSMCNDGICGYESSLSIIASVTANIVLEYRVTFV